MRVAISSGQCVFRQERSAMDGQSAVGEDLVQALPLPLLQPQHRVRVPGSAPLDARRILVPSVRPAKSAIRVNSARCSPARPLRIVTAAAPLDHRFLLLPPLLRRVVETVTAARESSARSVGRSGRPAT
jgi:hypothetical protein